MGRYCSNYCNQPPVFKEKNTFVFSWTHASPNSCGLEPTLHIAKKCCEWSPQSSINVVGGVWDAPTPQNEVSLVLLSHTKKNIVSSILMKYTTDVEPPFVKYPYDGEVGCCESRMAERSHWWTESWLISLTFSLSLSLSLLLSSLIIYVPT